jgi:hypothetical protein
MTSRKSESLVDEPAAERAPSRRSLLTERYSASNEAARAAEQQRIWAMTPYERIALAFALGRSRAALQALGSSLSKPKP